MKILVCGDSYATDHEHYSWLKLVENYFNCRDTTTNFARAGSSVNYSYKRLKHSLDTDGYDVVIFVLTSADRQYHRDMMIHGGFPQHNDGTLVSNKLKEAIKSYYLHLYDSENTSLWHSMACHALAQISLEFPNTKFIFIPAFKDFENITKGNCVITSNELSYYTQLDKKSYAMELRGEPCDVRANHLSSRQNETLSNYVINFIDNYEFGVVNYKSLDKLKTL